MNIIKTLTDYIQLKNFKLSAVRLHAWSANHSIDFNNSQVIDKGSSRIRKTLESWHTASIDHADNNSRPLPNQYSILLKKNN